MSATETPLGPFTDEKGKEEVQPRRRRGRPPASSSATKKVTPKDVREQLEQLALAASMMALLSSPVGSQAVQHPAVVEAIQSRAAKFAAAWEAVAKQDERVLAMLSRMMVGGVWATAVLQTAGLGVTVLVLSGRAPIPVGLAQSFIPELAGFQFVPAQPQPQEPPADVNGQPPGWDTPAPAQPAADWGMHPPV